MWQGLFITTREILLKINNLGKEKYVQYDTKLPGGRDEDIRKSKPGSKQVRFSEDNINALEANKMRLAVRFSSKQS